MGFFFFLEEGLYQQTSLLKLQLMDFVRLFSLLFFLKYLLMSSLISLLVNFLSSMLFHLHFSIFSPRFLSVVNFLFCTYHCGQNRRLKEFYPLKFVEACSVA